VEECAKKAGGISGRQKLENSVKKKIGEPSQTWKEERGDEEL